MRKKSVRRMQKEQELPASRFLAALQAAGAKV